MTSVTQSRATDLILPYEVEKDVSDTDSEVERRVGAGITLTDGPCHRSAGGVGGGEQGVGTGGGAEDRDVAAVAHWCGVWERHCVLGPRAVRWVLCNRAGRGTDATATGADATTATDATAGATTAATTAAEVTTATNATTDATADATTADDAITADDATADATATATLQLTLPLTLLLLLIYC